MVFNGDHYERRAAPAAEAPRLPPHEQPLGGFIFFCNDETMPLDFERCLFGLPKSFVDSVRGIRKGLPLFLYNYSNRYLHGVFEASSDGGLNLEPNAWATRDARSGVDVSRYPAQVRVRARDIRSPLQEDAFRPVLYHYEPKKFRLELSVSQTAALLKLFSSQIMEPNPARKRNGFAGHSNGSSRADLSRAWRSPLSSFGVDAPAADRVGDDQIRMVEAVSNGDGVERFSYVAALKSGIQPGSSAHERTENGRTSKVCAPAAAAATSGAAVLGRLHDPDPAVNSDHQQQFPIYAKPPGKKTSPPTRPWKQKDETRKKPPTIHLHSFTHLPQVPLLGPVRFPVYAPQVTEVDGFYYRPVQRVEAYAPLQPSAVGWSPSPQPAPVVFLPPPPPPPAISIPSPVLVESNFGVLHAEILEFARTARPSPSARARAEAAVECVRRGVKQHWPGADVEVFGSFATGLCLPHSDVDVVVLDAPGILEAAEVSGARAFLPLIRGLAAEFKDRHNWCKSLMTIETASMPVIKLCCEPFPDEASDAPPVAIDVTLGGRSSSRSGTKKKPVSVPASAAAAAALVHNGAAAREYVLDKLRQLPALAPLVLLMKSFLHRRGLNSVYTGGLGSFSLTLLLVFYLEQVPLSWSGNASTAVNQQQRPAAAAVPQPAAAAASAASSQSEVSDSEDDETVVTTDSTSTAASEDSAAANGCANRRHEELISRAWRIVDDLLVCLQAPGAPNLGSLLIGFLHIFGQEFDFSRAKIMLKSCNGSSGVLEPSFQPTSLWIDDPLRPGMNVGAGSFAMSSVQAAMRDMLFVLAKPQQPGDEDHQHERPCSSLPHLDQLFQVS